MSTSRCRVCLTETDCVHNIFTGRCSNGQSYAETLTSCIDGITVKENDSLPSHICETCVSGLESWVVCGKIEDGFATNCVFSGRTKTESDELSVRRTKINTDTIDEHKDIETEEICIKTESDDEYFRADRNEKSVDQLEKKLEPGSYEKSFVQEFDGKKYLIRYFRLQNPYGCDDCGKMFKNKTKLAQHLQAHHGKNLYECDRCEKTFSKRRYLMLHLKTHSGEKPYKCDRCEKSFCQKVTLKQHLRTHTGEKPFACDRCKKSFSQKTTQIRHSLTHVGEKPYECDRCGKSFCRKSNLKRHTDCCAQGFREKSSSTEHLQTRIVKNLRLNLRTHVDKKPYECDRCGERFGKKHFLTSHLRTHDGENLFTDRPSRVELECDDSSADRSDAIVETACVKTEETCLKTESHDVYFRTDFDRTETDPLEMKPFECDS